MEMRKRISEWTERGYMGVWLRLPREDEYLLSSAFDVGFNNHHSVDDYFMLVKWLGPGESKLPQFGTHVVRVEAFVKRMSKEGKPQVLLVQEKVGMGDRWKLVSGAVEAGEFVVEAARREVHEEVGLRTRFIDILGFANRTKRKFGRSEVIVCCAMEVMEGECTDQLVLQEDEIARAKWFDVEAAKKYWEGVGGRLELCWLESCGGMKCARIVDFCGGSKRMHCFYPRNRRREGRKEKKESPDGSGQDQGRVDG